MRVLKRVKYPSESAYNKTSWWSGSEQADAKSIELSERLGGLGRRLLCGGFASRDRRMNETRNNAKGQKLKMRKDL